MTTQADLDSSSNMATQTVQYCTFLVADMYFGIDVLHVQEVLRTQEVTHVPLAPPVIAGLMNLRGQIVPAVDMRQRLSLPIRPRDTQPMNLVLRTEEGAASLLVDEIGDVVDIDRSSFEPAPDSFVGDHRTLVRGVCKLRGCLLLVLDAERALDLGTSDSDASVH
jgi:purine-binding chemotaxis protein CheW